MKNLGIVFFVCAALSATNALAVELAAVTSSDSAAVVSTTPANQSNVSETVTTPSILDDIYVSYFGTLHGPGINHVDSPYTVNNKGQASKTAVNMDSDLTVAYLFTKDIGLGPQAQFIASPVLGKGFTMGDFGLKVFNKHFIRYEGFNVSANFYFQLPAGYDSIRGMDYALKTTPAISYQVPHSRFTLGAWTEAKNYAGVDFGTTFKLYAQPYAKYQLTPSVALNLGYEMEWHHDVGATGYFNFATNNTDLMPGIVWAVTPKIFFGPYLQIFTNTTVNSDATALGATLSASL